MRLIYVRWPDTHLSEPAKWHMVLSEGLEASSLYPEFRNRIKYCWLSEYPNSLNLGVILHAFNDYELRAEMNWIKNKFFGAIEAAPFPNAQIQVPTTAQILKFSRGSQAA